MQLCEVPGAMSQLSIVLTKLCSCFDPHFEVKRDYGILTTHLDHFLS